MERKRVHSIREASQEVYVKVKALKRSEGSEGIN